MSKQRAERIFYIVLGLVATGFIVVGLYGAYLAITAP